VKEAGVPLFKTEILHDPEVCLRGSGLQLTYSHVGGKTTEEYRKLIERKTVSLGDYAILFAECRKLGVPFVASVYDFEGVDFLLAEGGVAIKIAGQTGLPVIFDAGLAYVDEIGRAVRAAREEGAEVVVNHHPGPNPTPAERQNLRVMQTWKRTFECPVGLACHYRGEEILYAAVGLGVNLIEKGVVDDNTRAEQDVVSALNLREVGAFRERLHNCWLALGSTQPVIVEPRDLSVRKGAAAKRDMAAGEVLSKESVRFAWPPEGVGSEYWEVIEGRVLRRAVAGGEPIRWSDVEFE
jgi:sialic acid synthase SpsE